MPVQLLQGRVV